MLTVNSTEVALLQGGPAGIYGWNAGELRSTSPWLGTMRVDGGTLVARRVVIRDQISVHSALSIEGGRVTLVSCTFIGNQAKAVGLAEVDGDGSGGVIRASAGATLLIQACQFESNSAAGSGGAIFLNGSVECTILQSSFKNHQAGRNGGAIGVIESKMRVESSSFDSSVVEWHQRRRRLQVVTYIDSDVYQ